MNECLGRQKCHADARRIALQSANGGKGVCKHYQGQESKPAALRKEGVDRNRSTGNAVTPDEERRG